MNKKNWIILLIALFIDCSNESERIKSRNDLLLCMTLSSQITNNSKDNSIVNYGCYLKSQKQMNNTILFE